MLKIIEHKNIEKKKYRVNAENYVILWTMKMIGQDKTDLMFFFIVS